MPIPRSYAAAVADPVYGAKWRAACDDDYKGEYTLLGLITRDITIGTPLYVDNE